MAKKFDAKKAMRSVVDQLEKWADFSNDKQIEKDTLNNSQCPDLENMRIGINMNLLALYENYDTFRFNTERKTYIFIFKKIEEAFDLAQNIIKISSMINNIFSLTIKTI